MLKEKYHAGAEHLQVFIVTLFSPSLFFILFILPTFFENDMANPVIGNSNYFKKNCSKNGEMDGYTDKGFARYGYLDI